MSTEEKKKAKYLKRAEQGKKGIKPKAKKKGKSSPKSSKKSEATKNTVVVNGYAVLHGEREAALAQVQVMRSALINIKAATEGSRWKEAKLAHELASEALAEED